MYAACLSNIDKNWIINIAPGKRLTDGCMLSDLEVSSHKIIWLSRRMLLALLFFRDITAALFCHSFRFIRLSRIWPGVQAAARRRQETLRMEERRWRDSEAIYMAWQLIVLLFHHFEWFEIPLSWFSPTVDDSHFTEWWIHVYFSLKLIILWNKWERRRYIWNSLNAHLCLTRILRLIHC